MNKAFITIAGRQVCFRHAGKGYPLVLLHGSHRSGWIWHRNMDYLGEHFSVYAPDRPGYGDSDPVLDTDAIPDMADFAHAFLTGIGYSKAHWIGESRGGGICIELATRFPSVVDRLVLCSPIGLPPNELPKPPEIGKRSKWEWFLERSFEGNIVLDEESKQIILENLEKASLYEDRRLKNVSTEYNTVGLLRELVRLQAPTLLVWGRQDPVFPVESIERFKQLLPNLESTVIINKARHLSFYEHPDLFSSSVVKFLDNTVVS